MTARSATACRKFSASSLSNGLSNTTRRTPLACGMRSIACSWSTWRRRMRSPATAKDGWIAWSWSSTTSARRGGGLSNGGDAESAQQLCAGLYRLLVYRGHATEGRASLLEALALPGGSPAVRGKALHCLASLAFTQADYVASARSGQESLTLRQTTGDQAGIAWSYIVLAYTATMSANWSAAADLLENARTASRRGGERYALGLSLSLSALAAYLTGDYAVARDLAQQTLEIADSSGFASIECMALSTLGSLSYLAGDRDNASAALQAALARAEALGEVYLIVRAALGLALIATDSGDTARGRVRCWQTASRWRGGWAIPITWRRRSKAWPPSVPLRDSRRLRCASPERPVRSGEHRCAAESNGKARARDPPWAVCHGVIAGGLRRRRDVVHRRRDCARAEVCRRRGVRYDGWVVVDIRRLGPDDLALVFAAQHLFDGPARAARGGFWTRPTITCCWPSRATGRLASCRESR